MPFEPPFEAQQPAAKPVIHDSRNYQQGGKAFSDVRAAGKGSLPPEFGGCSIHDGQSAVDARGGRSQVSTAGDGSKTEVYTPPLGPQTTITDTKGNQTYRAGLDASGNYSQSGRTTDGNAWTMTSDKNGGTSGQTWDKNGTSSWSADRAGRTTSSEVHNDGTYSSQAKDQTGRLVSGESGNETGSTATTSDLAGNTTTTFKPAEGSGLGAETSTKDVHGDITDQQKWSADGTIHAQANATADGSVSRTYDKNGQIIDQQQWDKTNSLTHSGTTADGKKFSVSSDASGHVYKTSEQDKSGNTTVSGEAHDRGTFYSHTNDSNGKLTDEHYWNKNGSQYHGGEDANGHSYSENISADGNKTSFKDSSGTTNYDFDKSSGASTKSFTSNDNASKNYEMKTDANGGSFKTANGVTSWDNKGGMSYEKANGGAKVSWNTDGVTSRSMTTADGGRISSTTDAQGHVIDHQSYDASGGMTRTGELSAHGGSYIMKVDANGYPTSFSDTTGVHNYAYKDGRTTDTFSAKPVVSAWGPAPVGDAAADKPGIK